jgi:hypothetical protein
MISVLNFIKIYELVQKLLVGGLSDRGTDRQTGDLVSLTFLFKESRLKRNLIILRKALAKNKHFFFITWNAYSVWWFVYVKEYFFS